MPSFTISSMAAITFFQLYSSCLPSRMSLAWYWHCFSRSVVAFSPCDPLQFGVNLGNAFVQIVPRRWVGGVIDPHVTLDVHLMLWPHTP